MESIAKWHLKEQPIPKGFVIFEDRLDVTGIVYRKKDAAAFVNSNNIWLELEREENNKYDSNAIKIIGCSKGFLGTKRRFIGYVPKEVAATIVEKGFWGRVMARLLKTYLSENGFVAVMFQVLGPKGEKQEYQKHN